MIRPRKPHKVEIFPKEIRKKNWILVFAPCKCACERVLAKNKVDSTSIISFKALLGLFFFISSILLFHLLQIMISLFGIFCKIKNTYSSYTCKFF